MFLKLILFIIFVSPLTAFSSFSTNMKQESFQYNSKLRFKKPNVDREQLERELLTLDRIVYLFEEFYGYGFFEEQIASAYDRIEYLYSDISPGNQYVSSQLSNYTQAMLELADNNTLSDDLLNKIAKKQMQFLLSSNPQEGKDFFSVALKPNSCTLKSIQENTSSYIEIDFQCTANVVLNKHEEIKTKFTLIVPENPDTFYIDQLYKRYESIIKKWFELYPYNNSQKDKHIDFMKNILETIEKGNWMRSLSHSLSDQVICRKNDDFAVQVIHMADIFSLDKNCPREYKKKHLVKATFTHQQKEVSLANKLFYPEYDKLFIDEKPVEILYLSTGNEGYQDDGKISMTQNTSVRSLLQQLVKSGYQLDQNTQALFSHNIDLKKFFGDANLDLDTLIYSPFIFPIKVRLVKRIENQDFVITVLNRGCTDTNGYNIELSYLYLGEKQEENSQIESMICNEDYFYEYSKKYIKQHSVIAFEGHAGYGDNIYGVFENESVYKDDDYKVLLLGGCDTFYYGSFDIPKYISQNYDNSNVDMVTTLGPMLSSSQPFLYFVNNLEIASQIYDKKLSQEQAYNLSWQSMITNMDFEYKNSYANLMNSYLLYMVTNVEENKFLPKKKDN